MGQRRYEVVDGVVRGPGRFAGEPGWVPYAWDLSGEHGDWESDGDASAGQVYCTWSRIDGELLEALEEAMGPEAWADCALEEEAGRWMVMELDGQGLVRGGIEEEEPAPWEEREEAEEEEEE